MHRLYSSYSLDKYCEALDFVELSWAEVDYCLSQTASDSKLRVFILDILSHHITFGNYIRIKEASDWYKLFVKYPDFQLQLIAKIAESSNRFTSNVTEVPSVHTYLETPKAEDEDNNNET
jgi:hypothetical protein